MSKFSIPRFYTMTLPFIYYTLNYNTALYATFFVVLHNYFFNIQYCTSYSLHFHTSQKAPSFLLFPFSNIPPQNSSIHSQSHFSTASHSHSLISISTSTSTSNNQTTQQPNNLHHCHLMTVSEWQWLSDSDGVTVRGSECAHADGWRLQAVRPTVTSPPFPSFPLRPPTSDCHSHWPPAVVNPRQPLHCAVRWTPSTPVSRNSRFRILFGYFAMGL